MNPVQILCYDPNRNNYRRVEVEGLGDDQFGDDQLKGNGDNDFLYTLAVYSNHIETLMSF